jgi:hypothetical protein
MSPLYLSPGLDVFLGCDWNSSHDLRFRYPRGAVAGTCPTGGSNGPPRVGVSSNALKVVPADAEETIDRPAPTPLPPAQRLVKALGASRGCRVSSV